QISASGRSEIMALPFACVECNGAYSTSIERLLHRYSCHPQLLNAGGGNCRICGQNVLDLFANVDHLMNEHPAEFAYLSSEVQHLNSRIGNARSAVYWLQETCQPPGEQPQLSLTPLDIVNQMRLRAASLRRVQNGAAEMAFALPRSRRDAMNTLGNRGMSHSEKEASEPSNPAATPSQPQGHDMIPCSPSTSTATTSLHRKRPMVAPTTSSNKLKVDRQLRESPPSDCIHHSRAIATSSALPLHTQQHEMKDMNNG
ncbi:hypothetical protein PMAYCL1PPCAC_26563, partial [Pristionchus mayeri]